MAGYRGKRMPLRVCRRCGQPGRFTANRQAKVCDACRADPASAARHSSDAGVRWARARNLAMRRLIEAHRDEWDALLAEERQRQVGEWPATARELDDYDRRIDEAVAAGWSPGRRLVE